LSEKRPVSRALILLFALVFLFETWVWDSVTRAFGWLADRIPWQRIRRATKDFINRLPAFVAVLLFGVPVIAMETGSAMAVVFAALGHVVMGAILYALMKLFGVTLIGVIYDLTEEKLMTLPWFVWVHGKFEYLHEIAREFVAPYREAAKGMMQRLRERAATGLGRFGLDLGRARRQAGRAQKPDALSPGPGFD
jgi:hypothetical protein